MNPFQKKYQTFIESVCTQFECKDAIAPLQEGFSALCEATFSEPSIADDHTAEEAAECHLRKAGYVTRCSLKDVGPEGGAFEVICLTREPLEAMEKELTNNGYGIIGHITEDSELPYFILPVSVPREATGRGKEDFMRILGKYIAPEEPGGAEPVGYSDGIPVYKATEETKKMLGESSDEDYDGRDSFTRCRNCGAEVYDDDLDNQGYCPDCHDVCYTDTRTPTKWDRM